VAEDAVWTWAWGTFHFREESQKLLENNADLQGCELRLLAQTIAELRPGLRDGRDPILRLFWGVCLEVKAAHARPTVSAMFHTSVALPESHEQARSRQML
jgi:hypothetical protein